MELKARQQMLAGKTDITDGSPLLRFFNTQLERWETAKKNYRDLKKVKTKELPIGEQAAVLQFNPARIVSTGAKIDKKNIEQRPCFLCEKNRPQEQKVKIFNSRFDILVNPFPILQMHFTITSRKHQPQTINGNFAEMMKLLNTYPELTVFYNGPKCGASAPDHLHFQAGTGEELPLRVQWARLSRNLKQIAAMDEDNSISEVIGYLVPALVIRCNKIDKGERLFKNSV